MNLSKSPWVAAGMMILFLSLAGCTASANSGYDKFAKCLTKAGLVMYGSDTCSHCQDQKKMFGEAFEHIEYVNCQFDKDICDAQGVVGYPTWNLNDEFFNTGVQSFNSLAEASGCTLPEIE